MILDKWIRTKLYHKLNKRIDRLEEKLRETESKKRQYIESAKADLTRHISGLNSVDYKKVMDMDSRVSIMEGQIAGILNTLKPKQ